MEVDISHLNKEIKIIKLDQEVTLARQVVYNNLLLILILVVHSLETIIPINHKVQIHGKVM